jgi:hypothetical protein
VSYVKLDQRILSSSVWEMSAEARICWVTLLLVTDKNGRVQESVASLARRANISRDAAAEAIAAFCAPDPDSSDPSSAGRRLLPIEGGWKIVTYETWRERLKSDTSRELGAARQARYAQKSRPADGTLTPADGTLTPADGTLTPADGTLTQCSRSNQPVDVDVDADVVLSLRPATASPDEKSDPPPEVAKPKPEKKAPRRASLSAPARAVWEFFTALMRKYQPDVDLHVVPETGDPKAAEDAIQLNKLAERYKDTRRLQFAVVYGLQDPFWSGSIVGVGSLTKHADALIAKSQPCWKTLGKEWTPDEEFAEQG